MKLFKLLLVGLLVTFGQRVVEASIQLVEFDVTNAVSASSAAIPALGQAAGITTSPLVPIGVNFGGVSSPGLYWDSAWTTAGTPNSISQRLFFNLIADPGATVTFDTFEFDIFSGGSSLMGVELRVFGAGGSTLAAPQLTSSGFFSSPVNFATHVSVDVSSLIPISDGEGYQFSLSFFNRNPSSRIGLSGDLDAFGVDGSNPVLTGDVSSGVVPEPLSLFVWGGLIAVAVSVRRVMNPPKG